jgi:thiamine biosynthesis lipoprotein
MLETMIKHLLIGLAMVFGVLTVTGRGQTPSLERFTFTEPHMGTLFRIVLYAADEAKAKTAAQAAFARIAELDGIMSDYKPASELMKLCKKAGGDPVQVSADLFAVLEKAQEIAGKTDGAFDVTVGPIVRLWRKARRTRKLPDAEELKRALALVGYEKMKLDPAKRTVQLLVMGMLLDLGGIAKGYAADAALEVLRSHGIGQALVAAGGDIRVGEAPPGKRGWKIGIAPLKKPADPPDQFVLLVNAGVSTAGDAHQFVEIDGKRYSHIVDPRGGRALEGRRSVTVIAANDTTADVLDTALCVMGAERGLKLIEGMNDVAALYVFEDDGKVITRRSKGFAKFEVK